MTDADRLAMAALRFLDHQCCVNMEGMESAAEAVRRELTCRVCRNHRYMSGCDSCIADGDDMSPGRPWGCQKFREIDR